MPFNGTPYSNLPPDAKWWLHIQPNYLRRRGLNIEQFNDQKVDVDLPTPDKMESRSVCEDSLNIVNYEVFESFFDERKSPESRSEELNGVDGKVDQDFLDVKNMADYYELLDGEELASFVAHKSLLHIGNCDLPPPQKMKVRRELLKQPKSMDHDEIYMASLDCQAQTEAISSSSSGGSQGRRWSSVEGALSQDENVANEPIRSSNRDTPKKESISVKDSAKAKLLEALCHSQTRAREAEKAGKEACTEKDHILKLFFRQASQLFAYKQWLKMLQLENLLLQTGNEKPSPSSPFPDPLKCTTVKPNKSHKNWQKSSKAKQRKTRSAGNDIGKYVVAIAVGFTLVGAGLILGWTVGWLMPAF